MRGVQISGLEALAPTDAQKRNVQALTTQTFRILRQRWNLNVLRLPVSPAVWRRDGEDYLSQIAQIVQHANAEGLLVVLVAAEDTASGLPAPELADFWTAWATFFRDNGLLIFDLYARPLANLIPAGVPGKHQNSEWTFWRNGGVATNERAVTGMQQLVLLGHKNRW